MGWAIRDSASSGASPSPMLSWAETRAAARKRTAVSASRIGAEHTGDPPPCVQYEFLHACRVVNARTLPPSDSGREFPNESWHISSSLPGSLRRGTVFGTTATDRETSRNYGILSSIRDYFRVA